MNNCKSWKRIVTAGAAAAAALMLCVPGYAETMQPAGPGNERSAEEWARLRDDTLEYGEIRGLVEEYNADVMELKKTYQNDEKRVKSAEQTAKNLKKEAEMYDDMAQAAEEEIGSEVTAASYRLQAEELRKQSAESTNDGSVIYQNYLAEITKKVKDVKNLFVSYYKALDAIDTNEAEAAYKERELYYTNLKYQRGLITFAEVKSAQEAVNKTKEATQSLKTAAENCRKDLITACGWKYNAVPVIGPLPAEQELILTAEQDAVGLQTALNNSSLLTADRTRLENAKRMYGEGETTLKAQKELEKDTDTVTAAYQSVREDLLMAQKKLSNEDAALATARKQLALTQKQLEAGTASKMNVEKAQYDVDCAVRSRFAVIYDLMQARHAYDAVLEGAS